MNPPQTLTRKLITIEELAPFLGFSVRYIRELRKQKLIPFIQVGRLVRYNPEKVMEEIEKLTRKAQGAESRPIPQSYRR